MKSVTLKRTLEVPLLFEFNDNRYFIEKEKKQIEIYDLSHIDAKLISTLNTKDTIFYISADLCLTHKFQVISTRTGKVIHRLSEGDEKAEYFDYFPKPLRYQRTVRGESNILDFEGERDSEIEMIIAPLEEMKNTIRVWKVKWEPIETSIKVTFISQDDIEVNGIIQDMDEIELDTLSYMTIGKDILIIKTYLKIIFYSITKQKILAKWELAEGDMQEFGGIFMFPNGKIGVDTDSGIKMLNYRVTGDGTILEGDGSVTNLDFLSGSSDASYLMTLNNNGEDFTLIYEMIDILQIYKINDDGKEQLSLDLSQQFLANDNEYFVTGVIGNLLLLAAQEEKKKNILYDMDKKEIIREYPNKNLTGGIRVDNYLLVFNKKGEGTLIDEKGNEIQKYKIDKPFNRILPFSKREKEVLKCTVETLMEGYVAKPLVNIIRRFLVI